MAYFWEFTKESLKIQSKLKIVKFKKAILEEKLDSPPMGRR